MLDPQHPASPGPHTHFLPQMYVLRAFMNELQALSRPQSLTAGADGIITRIAFDPAAIGRLKAQAELLGRCSDFLHQAQRFTEAEDDLRRAETGATQNSKVQQAAELAWLQSAVLRAHEAGLPEAVVLYSKLICQTNASEGLDDLDNVVERLCDYLLAGADPANALPVIVPLAHHLVVRLSQKNFETRVEELDLTDVTKISPDGDSPADTP